MYSQKKLKIGVIDIRVALGVGGVGVRFCQLEDTERH